ncbi:WD40 repeat domain-containing protein [Kibdelosporangium phytohabitans]|nr:WD40 repeat domain-containing protein [Kibdelosporangium phytohabitans]MBE1462396.1 WD40 repeat protein [Kibdelosporangium phytohabitans]
MPLRELGWHHGTVATVRFSPDSHVIASCGADDNTLRLWAV